jgi:NAD(P)-dependent dehydrogenase (short-subunit alcohol dehydrogenase family)
MKIACITGSAQGIGRAIALDLASLGYTIVIQYHTSEVEARELLEQIDIHQPKSIMLQANLTKAEDITSIFATIKEQFGQLDVLVNTVGNFGSYSNLEAVTSEEFDDVMNTNVRATQLCTQAALPLLRKSQQGRIINFGCASAEHALARKFTAPYYIAKSGVVTLTKSWAEHLAPERITVNAISPGIMENSTIKQDVPMGRPAAFADITAAVRFLISSEANYVSGANIEISGGWIPHHE